MVSPTQLWIKVVASCKLWYLIQVLPRELNHQHTRWMTCFIPDIKSWSPHGQNGCHFADNDFKCIFWRKTFVFWFKFHWYDGDWIIRSYSTINSLWPSDTILWHRWLVAWWHQAITWTNAYWSSVKSSDIHIMAISQEMPQPSITKIHLKITYLKFHSYFPEANELMVFNINFQCKQNPSRWWSQFGFLHKGGLYHH